MATKVVAARPSSAAIKAPPPPPPPTTMAPHAHRNSSSPATQRRLSGSSPTTQRRLSGSSPAIQRKPSVLYDTQTSSPEPTARQRLAQELYKGFDETQEEAEEQVAATPAAPEPQAVHQTTSAIVSNKLGDLIMWQAPLQTAISFVAMQMFLYSVDHYSLVSVLSYMSLMALAFSSVFYVYKRVSGMNTSTESQHPMVDYLKHDLTIREEEAVAMAAASIGVLNTAMHETRSLFLIEKMGRSAKFGLSLLAMTFVGRFVDMHVVTSVLYTMPMVFKAIRTMPTPSLSPSATATPSACCGAPAPSVPTNQNTATLETEVAMETETPQVDGSDTEAGLRGVMDESRTAPATIPAAPALQAAPTTPTAPTPSAPTPSAPTPSAPILRAAPAAPASPAVGSIRRSMSTVPASKPHVAKREVTKQVAMKAAEKNTRAPGRK